MWACQGVGGPHRVQDQPASHPYVARGSLGDAAQPGTPPRQAGHVGTQGTWTWSSCSGTRTRAPGFASVRGVSRRAHATCLACRPEAQHAGSLALEDEGRQQGRAQVVQEPLRALELQGAWAARQGKSRGQHGCLEEASRLVEEAQEKELEDEEIDLKDLDDAYEKDLDQEGMQNDQIEQNAEQQLQQPAPAAL